MTLNDGPVLQGLRTVVYYVPDLEKAKSWYRTALRATPYFDEPYYVGFSIGGYELGLHPREAGSPGGSGGSNTYWGVANIDDVLS